MTRRDKHAQLNLLGNDIRQHLETKVRPTCPPCRVWRPVSVGGGQHVVGCARGLAAPIKRVLFLIAFPKRLRT